MTSAKFSEVTILPVKPRDGLIGFASCVVDDWLYLGSIALHSKPDGDGIRLVYPAKTLVNGKVIHVFHPITHEGGETLTKAIQEAHEALIRKTLRKCDEEVETRVRRSAELY